MLDGGATTDSREASAARLVRILRLSVANDLHERMVREEGSAYVERS